MRESLVMQKIEKVLATAGRPLAAHEFQTVLMLEKIDESDGGRIVDGRFYIGCSESSLSRQLRKMRELGRVVSEIREGKSFKEYRLPTRRPVQQDLNLEMR